MSSSKASPATDDGRARRVSKKDQIISLYTSGIGEVEDLAMITGARPSYVASVLQESGLNFQVGATMKDAAELVVKAAAGVGA